MSGYGIGSFASGLASGFQAGQSMGLRADENRRRNEEFGLRKRVLTGQVEDAERERADDEAIRAAGRGAIETALAARGQLGGAPGVPAAAAGAPTGVDTAVATPYVERGAAAPAVTPGMEGMASPDIQPLNGIPRAGAPAAAAPAGPGMAPRAPGAPGQPPVPTDDDILAGLDASWKAALQRGRQDKGFEYFKNASAMRSQLRDRALDNADQQFQVTGDFSVYVEPYNRYVMDGGKVTGITKQADGQLAVGFEYGGKTGQKVMKPEELKTMIMTMRDRAAMRKHELAMAEALFKEKIKVTNVPEGGMAVSHAAVLTAPGGVIENTKDTKLKDQYLTIKGPKDEGDRVLKITPNGLVEATPGAGGGARSAGNPGKENLAVHKEIMDIAEKEFGEWDPVTGKNVLKGPNLTKALNRASIATQLFEGARVGGNPLDHATSYAIAANGETLTDAVFQTPGGKYVTQPAVRYQGKVYPLGGHEPTDVTERVQAAQKKGAGAGPKVDDLRATDAKPEAFGTRRDGTPKGMGFLGPLKTPDGKVATEFTIGVPINGKETDIPTLVPTLTRPEVEEVLRGKVSPAVAKKAIDFATERVKAGKSVFAEPGEGPAAAKAPAPKRPTEPAAPKTPAAGATTTAAARPGAAADLMRTGGVLGVMRAVEAMYPPSEIRSGRGGSARTSQDSPEVAKLKGLSGAKMLAYADELLAGRQQAAGIPRRAN